jgi:hypothetical protein
MMPIVSFGSPFPFEPPSAGGVTLDVGILCELEVVVTPRVEVVSSRVLLDIGFAGCIDAVDCVGTLAGVVAAAGGPETATNCQQRHSKSCCEEVLQRKHDASLRSTCRKHGLYRRNGYCDWRQWREAVT